MGERGGGRERLLVRPRQPGRGWVAGKVGAAEAGVGGEAAAGDLVASSKRARGLLRRVAGVVQRARGERGAAFPPSRSAYVSG